MDSGLTRLLLDIDSQEPELILVPLIFIYASGDCVDTGLTIDGKGCSEFVGIDECNCKKNISGFLISDACCASCENADTGMKLTATVWESHYKVMGHTI